MLPGFFNASLTRNQVPPIRALHSRMLFCCLCCPPKRQTLAVFRNQAARQRDCSCTSAILFFFPPYVRSRQATKQVHGYLFAPTAVKAHMNHYTENYFSFSFYMPDLDSFTVRWDRCHGNGGVIFLLISLHN